jgi:predicted alpha/beta hydrolase
LAARRSNLPLVCVATTPGGVRFPVRGLRAAATAPAVLILPAMGVPAVFYTPVLRALHATGLTVVAVDMQGQGESTPRVSRRSRFGYQCVVETDFSAVVQEISEALPEAPLVILGHSLGGQLALLHLAAGYGSACHKVRGVALVASGSSWYRGFTGARALRNLVRGQLYAITATIIGFWPGDRLGFGGRESRGVMRDWARQARSGKYMVTGGIDYERALGSLTLPVLAVDVENDDLAPPNAVDHLCSKIPNAVVTRCDYTTSAAGDKQLDHFRWVRHNCGLVPVLTAWIASVCMEGSERWETMTGGANSS